MVYSVKFWTGSKMSVSTSITQAGIFPQFKFNMFKVSTWCLGTIFAKHSNASLILQVTRHFSSKSGAKCIDCLSITTKKFFSYFTVFITKVLNCKNITSKKRYHRIQHIDWRVLVPRNNHKRPTIVKIMSIVHSQSLFLRNVFKKKCKILNPVFRDAVI